MNRIIIMSETSQSSAYINRDKFTVLEYSQTTVIDTDNTNMLFVNFSIFRNDMAACDTGNNYIKAPRFNDVEQHTILKKFGITMPRILASSNLEILYTKLAADKEYIVKYFGHARSIGQAVVNKENFMEFCRDCRILTNDDFASKYDTKRGDVRNWGVFEFSTEYGTVYPGNDEQLTRRTTDAYEALWSTAFKSKEYHHDYSCNQSL